MRRPWIVVGSVLAALALLWATYSAVGVIAREDETVTTELDAAGLAALDIRVESGSVEVVGVEGDEVRLTVELRHGLRRTGHRAEVEGDTLVVRSSCPVFSTWCDADYRLEVPASFAIDASVDDGGLVVRDVAGAVTADSDDGSVELSRLTGPVVATTENGSVVASGMRSGQVRADSDNGRVSLTFAAPPDTVEATTENGSVEVIVPDDGTAYRVDLDTGNGSTDVGIRTDPESDRVITGRSQNGNVTVRYPTG